MPNNKNILLATILSAIVLFSWTMLYEKPRAEQREAQRKILAEKAKVEKAQEAKTVQTASSNSTTPKTESISSLKNREDILANSKNLRVKISNENLHGSISLKGARFDDLTLAQYFENTKRRNEVVLFAPTESKERYFADFGWASSDATLDLPKPDTIWKSNSEKLTPENPVILSWKNKQGVEFLIKLELDQDYMFSVTQSVKNHSGKEISVAPYGRINRSLALLQKPIYILHEGAIGAFSKVLHEASYTDLVEERQQNFDGADGGWLGITDKYWLSAIIPDKNIIYKAKFGHTVSNQSNFFDSEFIGQEFKISPSEELNFSNHLFAGAKKVRLLDQYAKKYDITLFDRAVDFGWFYFLTKPFFFIIEFLYKLLGNFGLAILAMTVIIKAALYPMANKSFGAIAKIKKLQPKIDEIKAKCKDDRIALNRQIMELYKKERVNPASGCLPILIQIPIFFSLYKVLFVTLDMRQAPFYGWIKDLSAPDPTSIFNLFGLLPFETSAAFTIGIWPILMGVTMIIQQKLNPAGTDPIQAKILKFMPYFLTFILATFPAGLVIYWTWSNILSILQQWLISRRLSKN